MPTEKVDSLLDDCYVCDVFCTSHREDPTWNSHVNSLYADLLMTDILFFLRRERSKELGDLRLVDFFLSWRKIQSITGHGAAHWYMSFLMTDQLSALFVVAVSAVAAAAATALVCDCPCDRIGCTLNLESASCRW